MLASKFNESRGTAMPYDGFSALLTASAEPLLLVFVSLSAAVGLLAIISPRGFAVVASTGDRWIDTWRYFRPLSFSAIRRLDRWIDVDAYALRHSRLVGLAILTGAAVFFSLCSFAWKP